MCGIAGVIGTDVPSVRTALEAMVACQVHRGPDDQGLEVLEVAPGVVVGLGQRRLSIIDLSPAGHQPMVNPQTGDVLIYNGELYNFQDLRARLQAAGVAFRGGSDTEVILHALRREGPAALGAMCGMYALAYLDRAAGSLLLARDPMGIKPLYVAELTPAGGRGAVLAFASEVRALVHSGLVPREMDRAGIAGLLAHGAVPEPLTIFKGVRMFPPGAWQTFDLRPGAARAGRPTPHWSFPAVDPALDERAATERLRTTLDESVRDHLIADVPVGVFLSSGLDSTIVAALARRHTTRLRTFTVGFADNPDMSEGDLALRSAEQFGFEHRDIQITGEQALATMHEWLATLDQPSMDGLNTFIVSKAVRREGIVVALSGLGGDELLCGYPTFEDVRRIVRAGSRLAFLPPSARGAIYRVAGLRRPAQTRERLAEMARLGDDALRVYLYRRRLMSDRRLRDLGLDARSLGLDGTYQAPEALAPFDGRPADIDAAVGRYESAFYMRSMLLRDSDTNGMAHSLEIRVPMLDRRMLDLCHAIPGAARSPDGRARKHLLRAAFGDLLRPEIAEQRKRGFALPVKRWMIGPLRPLCEASLARLKQSGLVNPAEVDAVWRSFTGNPEMQVWSSALALVVLGHYLQQAESMRAAA